MCDYARERGGFKRKVYCLDDIAQLAHSSKAFEFISFDPFAKIMNLRLAFLPKLDKAV